MRRQKSLKSTEQINQSIWLPFSRFNDHVLTGVGQEAVDALVYSCSDKFEARFFHVVFEEEFGRVRDHFGPISSFAYHPDGKRFVFKFYFKKEFCSLRDDF